MTDSTTNAQSADSGFDIGSSVDDLFGEIASDSESDGDRWGGTDDGDESDAVEDQTAADVFDQLRTDAGDESGADDILADESPDDIIASADEPDPEPDAAVDAELLADDDELADLLLTGRSKETDGEFLWIDPDADGAGTDDSNAADTETDDSVTGDDGPLETISDSSDETETDEIDEADSSVDADANRSDDVKSGPAEDDTASEPVADGDASETDSDRTEANESSAGLLAKVRDILSGSF